MIETLMLVFQTLIILHSQLNPTIRQYALLRCLQNDVPVIKKKIDQFALVLDCSHVTGAPYILWMWDR